MKEKYLIPLSIVLAAVIVAISWVYHTGLQTPAGTVGEKLAANLEDIVLPPEGVLLPILWGDLGRKMVAAGVIDENKIPYEEVGEFRINRQNAGYLLNLLWAFGLSNKNPILENGPMTDPRYGNPAYFASTGGWTAAKGDPMEHYSRYPWVPLTPAQQALVEKASQNIYRPCCDNATYFPDCNHGMAMLGLLELLASEGVSEEEMYRYALQVNAYWFPDNYLTIAKYFQERGINWKQVSPREVLGSNFSSGSGYYRLLTQVTPYERQAGVSCGV